MTFFNKSTRLIRINKDYAICADEIADKTLLFDENVEQIFNKLS